VMISYSLEGQILEKSDSVRGLETEAELRSDFKKTP